MLRSLKLSRFKSFEESLLPLGPLTLLVGANASGKSNVRDALRFLHGCAQGYTLTEVVDGKWGEGGVRQWLGLRGGFQEISWRGAASFEVQVELDIDDLPQLRYSIRVELDAENGAARVASELLFAGAIRVFESEPQDSVFNREKKRALRVTIGGLGGKAHSRDYTTERSILSQVADDPQADASRDTAARARQHLRGIRFFDLDPDTMREPTHPGHEILGDRGENLSSVLQHIYRDETGRTVLLGWLETLKPVDVIDLQFLEDLRGRILVQLVEGGGRKTSALSASDGTLRFLAFCAILLSQSAGWINFFEEVDTGFHPTRLHLLLDLFERVAQFPVFGRQVLATSHNPQLLSFLSEPALADAILTYRLSPSGPSQAVRVLDIPTLREVLARQDLGHLFSAGFLEDVVAFLAPEPEQATSVPSLAGA
jgi:predicted ATPase